MSPRFPDIFLLATAVYCYGCQKSNPSNSNDDDNTDLGSDTDSDTGTVCDPGPYHVGSGSGDICMDFPPANTPDGCERILLSRNPETGKALEAHSRAPVISRDGSVVLFISSGDFPGGGLPEDTNEVDDIYAIDTATLEMEIVSCGTDVDETESSGSEAAVSADGRYVAFKRGPDVYRRDRINAETELVSISLDGTEIEEGIAYKPQISGDGNVIAFMSSSSELVEDDPDTRLDIFVRDMTMGENELITVKDDGTHVGDFFDGGLVFRLSDDGRYVMYKTFIKMNSEDNDSGESGDDSSEEDIYLKDRQTGKHRLVTTGADNGWVDPIDMSPDARYVLFAAKSSVADTYCDSCGSDGLNLIIADLEQETFERATAEGDSVFGDNIGMGMSADTRHIVFNSRSLKYCDYVEWLQWAPGTNASPIGSGFSYDRQTGVFSHITASDDGVPGIIPWYDSGIQMVDYVELSVSGDGSKTAFSTIMLGIVDDIDLPCSFSPRQIYLRVCD